MTPRSLFITDIDNTLFEWVRYYTASLATIFTHLENLLGVERATLQAEAKEIFTRHRSIEYPFLIQELPSVCRHYGEDIDKMLHEAVEPGRRLFKEEAVRWLTPYPKVLETMNRLRQQRPDLKIAALTDAPRYVAMWKLKKLGLLKFFDSIYGLADPKLPTDDGLGKIKATPDIIFKHVSQKSFRDYAARFRVLPDEYEKPGTRGFKTILMDYDLDESRERHTEVVWAGDNLRKDMALGKRLGVYSVWAKYGTKIDQQHLDELKRFSPPLNVEKNVALGSVPSKALEPDLVLNDFSEILAAF